MNRIYSLTKKLNLLADELSVKQHLKHKDYFGSIATIISLVRQNIKGASPETLEQIYADLEELEQDLVWLQNNYQIKPKTKKKKIAPNGREKNQCSKISKTNKLKKSGQA